MESPQGGHHAFPSILPVVAVLLGLGAGVAVAVGVPLASLLSAGLFLLCPLMMLGMHAMSRRPDPPRAQSKGSEYDSRVTS